MTGKVLMDRADLLTFKTTTRVKERKEKRKEGEGERYLFVSHYYCLIWKNPHLEGVHSFNLPN